MDEGGTIVRTIKKNRKGRMISFWSFQLELN